MYGNMLHHLENCPKSNKVNQYLFGTMKANPKPGTPSNNIVYKSVQKNSYEHPDPPVDPDPLQETINRILVAKKYKNLIFLNIRE